MDKVIFDIGNLIHIRNRWAWKFPTFSEKLTAKEIIKTIEFKKEFQEPYPNLSNFILKEFYKERGKLK